MGDYDSDDEKSQVEKLRYAKVPRGMFVSGWDDDADELIEEDKNPQCKKLVSIVGVFFKILIFWHLVYLSASIERMILWAVSENRISEVREILRLDADTVNARDNDGYTPLHRAAYNNFVDMAKLLLQYRANPNARTELGWTPLHSACKWNNADCAHLLLQFGADVNAESDGQQTPLHITATVSNCRNTATVLLLDRYVKARKENNSEELASVIARRTGMSFPIFECGEEAFDCETGLID
ncbi:hypothetical protein KR038_006528 [Drosophila bunnanda]|nr:hypothetical protein KR038_006528 [Drosophila bunnanda]